MALGAQDSVRGHCLLDCSWQMPAGHCLALRAFLARVACSRGWRGGVTLSSDLLLARPFLAGLRPWALFSCLLALWPSLLTTRSLLLGLLW